MGERVRRMTAREVEDLLRRYGFPLVSQKGSQRKRRRPEPGLRFVAPEHRGRTLPAGALRSIPEGAEIPESDWKD